MYGAWDQRFQMWGKTSKNKFINMAVKLHDFYDTERNYFWCLVFLGLDLRLKSKIEKWPISHIPQAFCHRWSTTTPTTNPLPTRFLDVP
jgi:hypothetical protein